MGTGDGNSQLSKPQVPWTYIAHRYTEQMVHPRYFLSVMTGQTPGLTIAPTQDGPLTPRRSFDQKKETKNYSASHTPLVLTCYESIRFSHSLDMSRPRMDPTPWYDTASNINAVDSRLGIMAAPHVMMIYFLKW